MAPIVVTFARDERLGPYLEALGACGHDAGAIVRASPDLVDGRDAASLLEGAGGLLLTGGGDVEPRRYGEAPAEGVELDTPLAGRDRLESALVAEARRRRLPVLAICRGLQLLNVEMGGTLWQDLPRQAGIEGHQFSYPDFPRDHRAHAVDAAPTDHPMHRWLERFAPIVVNSRHHQAVRAAAPGLATIAVAPDGVVEAMAAADVRWWAWGVQWHPENLLPEDPHRELFRDFLAATEVHR